jgi:glycosidase
MNEATFGALRSAEQRAGELRRVQRGVRHDSQLDPLQPEAVDSPVVTVRIELPLQVNRVECVLVEPEAATLPLMWVDTAWDLLNWTYVQIWKGALPARAAGTLVRYRINAYSEEGGDPLPADQGAVFSYLVGTSAPPAWVGEAILYQIMPDRFHPGSGRDWRPTRALDDVQGGTLRGVLHQLDYLVDLGVNCLWLTPIFPDHTHHGYHATDYFTVNPRLGTMEDVRELVEKAHELGLRLLLDFAANHCGSGHPAFQAALARQDSEYHDWFIWERWPDRYATFYNVQDLPKLNVSNPDVRKYLLDAALFWLTDVGFDGLRLDHANGVPLDFWTEFRRAIKSQKPEAWLFGEAIEPPDRQLRYAGRLDGLLDFLLNQKLRDTFAFGTLPLSTFAGFLQEHERFFPAEFSRPSFLDSHDMDRFSFVARGDPRRLKLAAVCQFTLSGQPIIYYGTETGVGQDVAIHQVNSLGMVEARQLMTWEGDQDGDLLSFYRSLIRFRQEHPVLASGRLRTLHVNDETQTFSYAREAGGDRVVVALNLSEEPRTIEAGGHSFSLGPCSGDVWAASSPL